MKIWSDGLETIVYDDAGLTFFKGDEVQELLSITGDALTLGPRKGLYSTTQKIFAVDASARTALVGESGQIPQYFDLSRAAMPVKLGFSWAAAEHIAGRKYFAVLPEDERLYFRFVELGLRGNVLEESEPECPAVEDVEAAPLLWARVPGGRPPVRPPLEAKGPFAVQKNAFGLAVADSGTGIVVVARAGETKFSAAVRLPVSGDETILACALERGFCVSGSIRENHSVLIFFNEKGQKESELSTVNRALITGGGMPFAAGGKIVAWPHSTNYSALLMVDRETAQVVGETRVPGGSMYCDSIFCLDERCVFLGSRSAVVRVEKGETEWAGAILERKNIPKRIREQHTPVTGAPMIQLRPLSEIWKLPNGGTGALGFEISNSGGPSTGVEIELSGDAIERGMLRPRKCRVGISETSFDSTGKTIRMTLPEFLVPAATEKGTKRTKVEPAVVKPVEIELEGRAAGSGFLMVRVKIGGSITSATGKAVQVEAR